VMIDRNVRFGFKYRSARKRLNGRFNSALAWRQIHLNSTMRAYNGSLGSARVSRAGERVPRSRTFLESSISLLRAKLKGTVRFGATPKPAARRVRYPELPRQRGSQLISARGLLVLPA
jgi:hypothetical protein